MNPFDGFGIAFANPWLLLLLLLIPVLAYLRGQRGGAPTVVFSSTESLRTLGRRVQSRAGNFLTGLLFLALALLIVAMARPQKGKTLSQVNASGIDILLVLDVSGSMLSEDFNIGNQRTNRVSVVKKVTEEFIDKRPNDRIGLIAFAGRPSGTSGIDPWNRTAAADDFADQAETIVCSKHTSCADALFS